MSHALLALGALGLIAVVAVQDWLYAPLRQETISSGLTGPYHGLLLAGYGLLAIGLCWAFAGDALREGLAAVGALALIGTAVTNTAWRWVDGLTGRLGGHEVWHLRFTVVVFLAAFALEAVVDQGALWGLTVANAAAPGLVWALSRRKDYAEKIGVLVLALWLIAWSV